MFFPALPPASLVAACLQVAVKNFAGISHSLTFGLTILKALENVKIMHHVSHIRELVKSEKKNFRF